MTMVQTNQLNHFPVKGGMSSCHGPRMILGGTPLDYTKHFTVPFGACVQANHESNPTNDNAACTINCICLQQCNNLQGGHELMDLNSGRVITQRGEIMEIPIAPVVIKAVEAMAEWEGFKSLKFKNGNGVVFHDTDWIAGVDYEQYNNKNDEDCEEDEDCKPAQDKDDKQQDKVVNEEIDQEEIDKLLAEAEEDEANPTKQ